MKFLVIKHAIVEGLGIFEQFCQKAGIAVDYVELEKGDRFPSLEGYAALCVMGGPMNVGEEADYPWLVEEKALIRQAVQELQLPYLGVCLGAQLLADALGGEVSAMSAPEVGLLPITLTDAGQQHPLTAGLPDTLKVLQWHGQAVQKLPPGATVLASSAHCPVQAYAVSVGGESPQESRVFGLQFHSEVSAATIKEWVEIPAYRADLDVTLGPTGCEALTQAVRERLPIMNHEANVIFDNFLKIVKG
ncbi:type 1 glutamine amidotransferase [Stenomitos frigidus]|nr:type 1 glutamine amidotransferase [Stenomitos frigidus]